MLYILFRLCCGIITLISYCTGFTYEEVNSILFIYGEPIVIGLCNLFILFKSFNHKILCVFITLYNIFYLFVISKIFIHYIPYSLHNACVVAYKDLDTLGSITGFGYIGIKYIKSTHHSSRIPTTDSGAATFPIHLPLQGCWGFLHRLNPLKSNLHRFF